ncbi:MAG TPA: hypothetical protein VK974_12610 [Methylophilaceae bacterium]|nr:hypothetical protein [Methylophilaceae bacterium]
MKQTGQRGFVLILGLGLIVIIALFSAYTWLSMTWSYSTGERAGYVQKFSNKGFVCKTWEGELAIVSMPGTMSEKFYFSVLDDAVATKINQSLGKKVTITYAQHIGVPSNCFGETQYFVDAVRVIED